MSSKDDSLKKFAVCKDFDCTKTTIRKFAGFEVVEVVAQKRASLLDGRTGFSKNRKIVEQLMALGYARDDLIPLDDVAYVIGTVRGSDDRTVRKVLKELEFFGFLEPATNEKVVEIKSVTMRTRDAVHLREYSTVKGFKFYKFGPRAPLTYQVKLAEAVGVNNTEGVGFEKYVCAAHGVGGSLDGVSHSSGVMISDNKNNNNTVLHTHINCKKESKLDIDGCGFQQEFDKDKCGGRVEDEAFRIFEAAILPDEPDKAKIKWCATAFLATVSYFEE